MTKARTVCCRVLTDVETAPKANVQNMELVVCNDTCKPTFPKSNLGTAVEWPC